MPITALLDQYEQTDQNPIKTFAMLFIRLGLGRVDKSDIGPILGRCLLLNEFSLFSQNLHLLLDGLVNKEIGVLDFSSLKLSLVKIEKVF